MKMKLIPIWTIVLFLLCGCKQDDYKEANRLFVNGNYEAALAIYSELGNYKDSVSKMAECEEIIESESTADNDFLADMEKSILYRMENADKEYIEDLINVEIAYLKKYKSSKFNDGKLKNICKKYLVGLQHEKESLSKSYIDSQIAYQRGHVERYSELNELYYNYGFLEDNKEFIAKYISSFDKEKKREDALNKIIESMERQLTGDQQWSLQDDGITIENLVLNYTEYSYDLSIHIEFFTASETQVGSSDIYVQNIKPHEWFRAKAYITDNNVTKVEVNYTVEELIV